jgi:RNA polymerase sporulation-specific sigma factor
MMLSEAITKLGERERIIMQLRFGFLDGRSAAKKQVADIIGIKPVIYFQDLKKRIIKRLRKELGR